MSGEKDNFKQNSKEIKTIKAIATIELLVKGFYIKIIEVTIIIAITI